MDKRDVIAFFDALAPQWDADMICDEQVIASILDGAQVKASLDRLAWVILPPSRVPWKAASRVGTMGSCQSSRHTPCAVR